MAPGVRFLPLGARRAELRNGGVVTRRDTEHMPTVAFCAPSATRTVIASGSPVIGGLEQLDTEENP